jgi:flagellar biosynthesis/type III secretory pathway protein FliH
MKQKIFIKENDILYKAGYKEGYEKGYKAGYEESYIYEVVRKLLLSGKSNISEIANVVSVDKSFVKNVRSKLK